jgi:hypothetical protein
LPVSHAADERLGQINPEKVTVNGITILSTEKDIIRILGEPREVEVGFDEPTAEKSKTDTFPLPHYIVSIPYP